MAEIKRGGQVFLTRSELPRRGWTKRMIADLAGHPDAIVSNVRDYPGQSLLYLTSRIEAIERSDAFLDAKAASRCKAAREAIAMLEQLGPRGRTEVQRWWREEGW